MKTNTSKWMRRISASLATFMIFMNFVGQASARILFQDDTVGQWESDSIQIGSNDAGATNTSITFGADTTGSENGVINWNITTNTFEVDHTTAITGGLSAIGQVNFSGATGTRIREVADEAAAACATVNEIVLDTGENNIYICTVIGTPGTWIAAGNGSNADTIDNLDSTQFLRSDTSDNFTSGTLTFDAGAVLKINGAFDANGVVSIGDGGDMVAIDSFDWDINAAGDMTGIGAITMDGLLTGAAGATLSGAEINLNNNSNFAVNVGTGTSTGTISIGGGSNTVAIDSSVWDISAAGAAFGFTTIGASGNITTSGGTFVVGTTALNEITANNDSGAFLIGAFDEFDNTASVNVQDILDDFDALIGSNADNAEILTFYPEYPDTVIWPDGGANSGTLSSAYDDTNDEHYYHWQTTKGATQDIDLKFRYPLPADFVSVGNFTYRFRTGSAVEGDNDVEMYVYNATDKTAGAPTLCGSDTSNVSAGTWATGTITAATLNAGCTADTALGAGDIIEVDVKLYDNSGGADYADVGYINQAYNN